MKNNSSEIVIDVDERIELTEGGQRFEAYCSGCKAMAEMATPKMASIHCGISEREVFRFIEARLIHFTETDRILVCMESVRLIPREV
jgi:hypothetical protein